MKSSRRATLLREMGLEPVWKLRGAQTPEPAEVLRAPETPRKVEAPGRVDAGPGIAEGDDRAERILRMDWQQLKAAVPQCRACPLCASRTHTVFGVGDENADWLVVGEAPGAEEDARGEPFVGQAGRLLDNMLASIGLRRGANVYIANVLKCRPPGNRNPERTEVDRCSPYLQRQIELIRPKLILAMGRFAVQTLLDTDASIGSLRGRVHKYRGVPLIVTYHPAYLLRSLHEKAKSWEDLCFARRTLSGL